MVVIITEGKSDIEFLNDFISTKFNISKDKYKFKNFEGKDNIFKLDHKFYDEIENELDIIDAIFITTDADDPKELSNIRGYNKTKEKLEELIKNLDFDIFMDYYIFCDEKKEGYLESFLLSVLDNKQKECIKNFKTCFQYELSDKWVYNSFYKHHKYPFDYSHPNFNTLREKLQNLFEGKIS